MTHPEIESLHRLAATAGIACAYTDVRGARQTASPEAICALLRALGHPVQTPADASRALREHEARATQRALPETLVGFEGTPTPIAARVSRRPRFLHLSIALEGGETRHMKLELAHGEAGSKIAQAILPADLPAGRHRLQAKLGAKQEQAHLLIAPEQAHPGPLPPRAWGAFLPLYSLLRAEGPEPIGTFSDLSTLGRHLSRHGASLLGTLPLLDMFLDGGTDRPGALFEPSPYAPISRRFFSPVYLDLEALPELAGAPHARALLASAGGQEALRAQRLADTVDFRAVWRFKRKVLARVAESLDEGPSSHREAFEAFTRAHPEQVAYARFRALTEARGEGFHAWPEALRAGPIGVSEVDPRRVRTHLFAQYSVRDQLARTSCDLAAKDLHLYLDLPVGVHPEGYDVFEHPEHFLQDMSAGAPPDPLFEGGQDWGFPPLSPRALLEDGGASVFAALEAHLSVAKVLRLDHVMGLHRLYVVPRGFDATQGLYLRYPRDLLFGLLTLASQRHGARIIGENLGTVPPEVDAALARHQVSGMWVGQFGIGTDPRAALPEPPAKGLSCLNTHDAPSLAGFLEGQDLEVREELGLCTQDEARAEQQGRAQQVRALERDLRGRRLLTGPADPSAVATAACCALGEGPAEILLINLEDLWGEARPQNVPGTHRERPNFCRRGARSLEAILNDDAISHALDRIDRARHPRVGMSASDDPGETRLSEDDLHLFGEGTHHRLYRKLGAHLLPGGGGTRFAVWAPNADQVSVIGDFNGWDADATPLASRGDSGVWEGSVLGVGAGALYKFHLRARAGGEVREKADPHAFFCEEAPRSASVVWDLDYRWNDEGYLGRRARKNALDAPIAIYELHLGSWMRAEDGSHLTYREIAPHLVAHLQRTGFTHVELLPVMEHPYYGSWGYQVTGYFAASSRFGTPQDLMFLIDTLHQAGLGVILDWVPAHFPDDEHALARFDGTHLYEHEDPRLGRHPDWDTLIFNYGRNEVKSFLLSSALFWLDRYHADGLRVDAVASMLYLDYSRKEGEWIPNAHGGRENLEALAFLRRMNEVIFAEHPGVQTFAEESTAWPGVSRPTYLGGVGFGLKWDMGWMHDTLKYFGEEPVHRRWHHQQLTFRGLYAFSENFTLPISHDEVVHGKGSLLGKMPGDPWQQRANLRLLFAAQWGQPGKKLLFMGCELGQRSEWNHESALEWHLLEDPDHAGLVTLVHDLNTLYRERPALHRLDCDPSGFAWIEAGDVDQSVYAWLRRGDEDDPEILVVLNCTPVIRENYRLGVPALGHWREVINTDAGVYGGSGVGNLGGTTAVPLEHHGQPASITLRLPPLGALFLERQP